MISIRTLRALAVPGVLRPHRHLRSLSAATAGTTSSRAGQPEQHSDRFRLYQYAICPFCNRVKAFLDYAGIDYDTVEVNPITKSEIKWSKDYRKVPIATWRDQTYLGSNVIVERLLERSDVMMKLEDRWQDRSMSMEAFQSKSAQDWSNFAQDELAVLLYPNMCRTWSDSYRAFAYVNVVENNFGVLEKLAIRSLGSLAMYMAASKIKKKRNITDEGAALNDVLVQLEGVGLRNEKFLSGMDEPDVGDFAVFGTLRSLEGLPVHEQIVEERKGPISDWYRRMIGKVQRHDE